MFGIGFFELCIIVGVALVCVGPQRLPELMRQMGKFFVQVRRMSSDVKSTVEQVIQDAEDEMRREEHKKIEVAITQQMNQGSSQGHHENPVLNVTPTAGEGSSPHHPDHVPPGSAASPHNPAAAAALAASSSLGLEQSTYAPATGAPSSEPAATPPLTPAAAGDERSAFERIEQIAEAPASSTASDKAAVKKTPSPDGSQSS